MALVAGTGSRPDDEQPAPAPLTGVRVLDLTHVLAGPFATCILGDLGADILKIEEPIHGDHVRTLPPHYEGYESHYFVAVNRNKRSVAVDLKQATGRDLVLDLARHCDVVVENFRPGVLDRLGLGFAALAERRSDVILCSISGFGRTGPMSDKPSFDLVTQALSGAMSVTGEPDAPPTKLGLPLGDLAGGLWGAVSVLAALNRRHLAALDHRSAPPQHIDLSLLEGMVGLLGYLGQITLMTGRSPGRVGSGHHTIVPYGRFEAADGHLVLALHVGTFWRRFCMAIGRDDLVDDPRFRTTADRRAHRDELDEIVGDILRTRTRAEWQKLLGEADIPTGPILDVGQALHQEQLAAREVLMTMHHPRAGDLQTVRSPVRFVGEELPDGPMPAPTLGEHTRGVLAELLGLDLTRLQDLERAGVIRSGAAEASGGQRP
jgi:crotonobetainyl-CoA:carnitine CoA-transferase CaiB-like acyl-CoA transferase